MKGYLCLKERHHSSHMNFEAYQYIVPAISALFLIRIGIQYVKQKRSIFSTVVWTIFWGVIAVLAFAPHILSTILADVLGFADNVHAVLFIGLGLAFLIIFYLSSVIDKLESQLTSLVRKLALMDVDIEDEDDFNENPDMKKVNP